MTKSKIDSPRRGLGEVGDVLFVHAAVGLPNGRRSRAGIVFTDAEDVKVTVVDAAKILVGNEVHVSGARMIMEDDALIKSTQPATGLSDRLRGELDVQIAKCAASDAEVQRLAAENARLGQELETKGIGLEHAVEDGKASDRQIADLKKTISGLQAQLDKAGK